MPYLPLNYTDINVINGTYRPSVTKNYNNATFAFWQRAFFQRACSTLIIDLPKIWEKRRNLMYFCLFGRGFVGCGELPEIGKWFNPGTISGFDFYYEPTTFILANPYYKDSKELTIGKDCELIKLTPDYMGIWDVISYYAEKMALIDVAINSAIINTKFAFFVGAKNKAAAEVIKKMFDLVNSGEPAVFFDKKLMNDSTDKANPEPWQALFRDNLKQSYIITDLLQDFQTIVNDFDTEVGIPTLPYQKKERMVTSEADSKQIDATSRSIVWFDTLTESCERVNEFLGFTGDDKLSVKLRYSMEGGAANGNGEDNIARNGEIS